ncbi:WD40/YVTN/BNR-like repeat-containing protein [Elongatibacter sediminis]|uniref:YCF48-related protein n=1 Tax=Elongatibacter sediminis TaxID=3119006 RepID=A0AAW9RQF5_9GAMM
MMRIEVIVCCCLLLTAAGAPGLLLAQTEDSIEEIEYAEHLPLVTQSLLLDTIKAGDRLLAVGERGHIVWSDDDGETWQQADVVPTRSTLTTLESSGGRLWAAGHDTVILTSSDGGRNWTRQFFDPERFQPVMDLHFFDERHGLAIGAYGLMLVTRDGGETWEDWAVNDEDSWHLNSIVELGDGTLLIAGEAGYSYRSHDQGETWEALDLPYQGSMFRALEIEKGCVLFAGLRGHVMRSCDGGDTWSEAGTGLEATLMDGVQAGRRTLLVGNGGVIIERLGANDYRAVAHPSGVDFASVLNLGDGRFLLTGEEGFYRYPVATDTGDGS